MLVKISESHVSQIMSMSGLFSSNKLLIYSSFALFNDLQFEPIHTKFCCRSVPATVAGLEFFFLSLFID